MSEIEKNVLLVFHSEVVVDKVSRMCPRDETFKEDLVSFGGGRTGPVGGHNADTVRSV